MVQKSLPYNLKLVTQLWKLTCISSSVTLAKWDPSAVLAEFWGFIYKFCRRIVWENVGLKFKNYLTFEPFTLTFTCCEFCCIFHHVYMLLSWRKTSSWPYPSQYRKYWPNIRPFLVFISETVSKMKSWSVSWNIRRRTELFTSVLSTY